MKGCDSFSQRHINHFLHFLAWFMSLSFVTSCGTDFLIFTIAVESSSIIIVYIQASSVGPETNMLTAKSIPIIPLNYLHNSSYNAPCFHLFLYALSLHFSCQPMITSFQINNTFYISSIAIYINSVVAIKD